MSSIESVMPPSSDGRAPSLWSSVREALRGSHQDYTVGNLNRTILLLAIPMVLEMVLESLFAAVDVFSDGRNGVGAAAAYVEDVADREQGVEHHFQHHGDA